MCWFGGAGLEGTTLYSRIQTDTPKTDPFTGLYLGTFGPHGPEVLHLQRSITEVCIRPTLCVLESSQDSFWFLCIDYGAAATSEKPAVHFNACDLHASLHILSNIGWRGVCAGSEADGGPERAGRACVLPRQDRAQAPPQRLRPHVPARAGHQRALCRRGPRCPQGIQGCPVSPSPSHYLTPFMVLQSLSPATLQFCLLFIHLSAIMKVAQHSLFSCVQRNLTSAVI